VWTGYIWMGGCGLDIFGWEGVEWIYLAQGKNKWWTIGNVVMNDQIP
jgi:hypothetical protein